MPANNHFHGTIEAGLLENGALGPYVYSALVNLSRPTSNNSWHIEVTIQHIPPGDIVQGYTFSNTFPAIVPPERMCILTIDWLRDCVFATIMDRNPIDIVLSATTLEPVNAE